jgi:hypothetical protein
MNQREVIMHRRLIILVVVLVVVAAHELNLAGLLLGLNPHAPR